MVEVSIKVSSYIALLLCLASGDLANSTEIQGQILQIQVNKAYGAAFVRMDKPPTTPAACSTNGYWHYTLPISTEIDKKLFSVLMIAQTTGKPIAIAGIGACNELGTVESATAISLTS